MEKQRSERCEICGALTGRAGRAEDSIFVILQCNFSGLKEKDELGPLCQECLDAMVQLGLTYDD